MSAPETVPPAHSKTIRLAMNAYHAALANDWRRVGNAFERLTNECGGEGLFTALKAWCDTFISHATGGGEPGRFRMVGWNVETGAIDDPNMPEDARWATRLIAARAAMDLDAFNAALQELNDIPDGYARGNRAGALLQCIAMTVNSLPRGYAQMGRPS